MELLNALLNLVDAVSTALGWVALWCTWVAPRRPGAPSPAPPSSPDELERFLRGAALKSAADRPA